MGKDLQRRNQLLRKRMDAKLNARKANRQAKGVVLTLEQENRKVLLSVLNRLEAQA